MASFFHGPSTPFEPPSLLHSVLVHPLKTFIRFLYYLILRLRGPAFQSVKSSSRVRLVCISDTHTHKAASIPLGDVLIHAGDLTNRGTVLEIQDHADWLSSLPHPNKIVIAGNHDSFLDPRSRHEEDIGKSIRWGSIHYLQHSSVALKFPQKENRLLTFYGAPQIPQCGGEKFAFQYHRSNNAWSGTVPVETDVLITHSPPRHHLDLPAGLGCEFLLQETWNVRPKVHVFGHVHAGYGREYVFWDKCQAAFERLCAREGSMLLQDLISIKTWADITGMVLYGLQGIVWSRVWGGYDGGVLINASLTFRNTGKIGNSPQVLDI